MRKTSAVILAAASAAIAGPGASAQQARPAREPVTVENYSRAQSDIYFAHTVKAGAFGKLQHGRALTAPGQRGIIRPNRDTLYSFGVFDLDAGPVTITLPRGAKRFMGMQVVNQDQLTPIAHDEPGTYTLTRETAGTRYATVVVRFLVDFSDPEEVRQVHALQDAIRVSQRSSGTFAVPDWDEDSLQKVRAALLVLGTTLTDTRGAYGAHARDVDPVKHLIASALLWGGNRDRDALYYPVTPARNDGGTVYRLTVGEVPVDGFWSVTVYNRDGYFDPNPDNAYSVNSLTAKKAADGSVTIQFGGCDGRTPNCLPVMDGWNYTVRLFRPRADVLEGRWRFPIAQPAN